MKNKTLFCIPRWAWSTMKGNQVNVKLDVQEELQRFKTWQVSVPGEAGPDFFKILGIITGYFQNLNHADWQVVKTVREIGPQLVAELDRLIARMAPDQAVDRAQNKKDHVLYAIYDRIESLLIVAQVNQERLKIEVYQQLLDYIQTVYTQELAWIRMESLGRTYNPDEYDGFVVDRSRYSRTGNPSRLEIVNELRAGFTCQGEIIRKPVVEFYE
jgi:hypothetical protein